MCEQCATAEGRPVDTQHMQTTTQLITCFLECCNILEPIIFY